MPSVFIDTNVPMYAAGAPHPLREPAQRVITAIADGALDAVTDAEAFQEILHRYFAIGRRDDGLSIFDAFHRVMAGTVLPVTDDDLLRARALTDEHPGLSPRDLIHLAVMSHAHIHDIISSDKGFDQVREVRRIPLESFVPLA